MCNIYPSGSKNCFTIQKYIGLNECTINTGMIVMLKMDFYFSKVSSISYIYALLIASDLHYFIILTCTISCGDARKSLEKRKHLKLEKKVSRCIRARVAHDLCFWSHFNIQTILCFLCIAYLHFFILSFYRVCSFRDVLISFVLFKLKVTMLFVVLFKSYGDLSNIKCNT